MELSSNALSALDTGHRQGAAYSFPLWIIFEGFNHSCPLADSNLAAPQGHGRPRVDAQQAHAVVTCCAAVLRLPSESRPGLIERQASKGSWRQATFSVECIPPRLPESRESRDMMVDCMRVHCTKSRSHNSRKQEVFTIHRPISECYVAGHARR